MKTLLRILASIFFILLFALFLILSGINFQLLNYDFFTNSLKTHNAYEKIPNFVTSAFEERKDEIDSDELTGYTDIKNKITPELGQEIIEKNLKSVFLFINEGKQDISFYLPFSKLGLQDMGMQSDTIPLSNFIKDSPDQPEGQPNLMGRIQGVGKIIFLLWGIVLILLAGILYAHYKLGIKGTGIVLIVNGILFIAISFLGKFFLMHMEKDLITSKEPSQVIIAILASSVLPDIINTWIILSGVTGVSGVVVLLIRYFRSRKK